MLFKFIVNLEEEEKFQTFYDGKFKNLSRAGGELVLILHYSFFLHFY